MFKKIFSVIMAAAIMCCLFAIGTFAEDFVLGSEQVTQITGALSSFSVANVLTVVVACFGIAVPLVLIWFAVRKVWSWAKAAFFGG